LHPSDISLALIKIVRTFTISSCRPFVLLTEVTYFHFVHSRD